MSDEQKECTGCDHCGMDMDLDPYCAAPAVLEKHPFGLNCNRALEKFCGYSDRRLWTIRRPR